MTSREDGYLFVVEYFMQYNFIICLDKIFKHKSTKPLFYNGHLKSAEPSSAKHKHVHNIPHFLDAHVPDFTKPSMFTQFSFLNIK